MIFEPLAGKRWVKVTQRRTATDFAEVIRALVEGRYPQAEKIVLVMDNLNTHKNTHKLASLYEAETELSVLARQCLNRRIADIQTLTREVRSWEKQRNKASAASTGALPPATPA
jgi:hypothetical protein